MTNPKSWIKERDRLSAIADDPSRSLSKQIYSLTELFFHFGQDHHEASKVVRRIQDKARVTEVSEIAKRIHEGGTVYDRMSPQEVSRKRNFSTLTESKVPRPVQQPVQYGRRWKP